ncbi:MAG: antibiotic biosynthesis monooxygenase [Caldilineaceae bacterium]
MYALIVNIDVKPEFVDQFLAVTLENAQGTRQEPGNLRFDVLRGTEDRNHFELYEVYRDKDALAAHRETAHYKKFAASVEPWLVKPRSRIFLEPVFYGETIVE